MGVKYPGHHMIYLSVWIPEKTMRDDFCLTLETKNFVRSNPDSYDKIQCTSVKPGDDTHEFRIYDDGRLRTKANDYNCAISDTLGKCNATTNMQGNDDKFMFYKITAGSNKGNYVIWNKDRESLCRSEGPNGYNFKCGLPTTRGEMDDILNGGILRVIIYSMLLVDQPTALRWAYDQKRISNIVARI